MKKMTRACATPPRPSSPKTKSYSVGTPPVRVTQDPRGVAKRQPSSPARTCLKSMTKMSCKADYIAQLKNLLPNSRQRETTSELDLVEQIIDYIGFLENILSSDQDGSASTMELLKSMKSMKMT